MKEKVASALALIALVLCACQNPQAQYPPAYALDSPPPSIDYAAQATITARQSQDAAATYEAASARQTAEALALTRQAEQATAVAASIATGTAQAYAVAAAATSDALSVRATESAMMASATREAQAVAATSTAQAQIASFEATLAADEATRLQLQRQAEADRQRRVELWSSLGYWLVAAASIVALAAAGVHIVDRWRRREPVREVSNGEQRLILVYNNASGDYQVLAPGSYPGPRQLPAPQEQLPAPAVKVLPELPEGHVMVVGPTRSGKSTAFRALLKHRQNVTVLDPHYAPGDWRGARVLGAGGNFQEIEAFMMWMLDELQRRREARARGVRDFSPVTVATDEMPTIADELGAASWSAWRKWLREGWKFGLYFMLSTQSTRVRTLGIEGEQDVLLNCAVLYLGAAAREAYPELARGSQRPAVLCVRGEVRAVTIPYIPHEDPNHPAFVEPPAPRQHRPRVILPDVPKIETPYGEVTPSEIARVLRMRREGHSLRAIEAAVFDYTGGAAHHKVKAVLQWAATKNGVNGHTVE